MLWEKYTFDYHFSVSIILENFIVRCYIKSDDIMGFIGLCNIHFLQLVSMSI